MKLVVGSWFSLPRLGTEEFRSMMKAGVRYEKGMGFMLTPGTDMREAVHLIERAIGERVELYLRCYVCLKEACGSCEYLDVCDRRSVSPMCLCMEHSSSYGSFEAYVSAFEKNLAE